MAITATERMLPSSKLKGFIGPPFCVHTHGGLRRNGGAPGATVPLLGYPSALAWAVTAITCLCFRPPARRLPGAANGNHEPLRLLIFPKYFAPSFVYISGWKR